MDIPFRPHPRWLHDYGPAYYTHGNTPIPRSRRALAPQQDYHPYPSHDLNLGNYSNPPFSHPISRSKPSTRAIPFEIAISKLKPAVAKAIEHFTAASEAFTTETELIRPYASPQTIDDLWRSKLAGQRNSATPAQAEDASPKETAEAFGEEMRAVQARLMKAMHAVAISRVRTSTSGVRDSENKQRAVRKVKTAFEDCREILRKVGVQFGMVAALVKELELVRTVIGEFAAEGKGDGGEEFFEEFEFFEGGYGGGR